MRDFVLTMLWPSDARLIPVHRTGKIVEPQSLGPTAQNLRSRIFVKLQVMR
jgi:hypothetical protein